MSEEPIQEPPKPVSGNYWNEHLRERRREDQSSWIWSSC